MAACCDDADCAGGSVCRDGACQTWCAQQTRPSGVAATDYACLDADATFPGAWSVQRAGAGTLAASTTRARSAPASVAATVSSAGSTSAPDTARLSWSATGSTPITSLSVSAQISPAAVSGLLSFDVDLMCLNLGDTTICLSYGNHTVVSGYQQTWDNYTGLYIHYMYSGPGAFLPQSCAVSGNLANNVWNAVTLTWADKAQITVAINGSSTTPCTIGMEQDTVGVFQVGMDTHYGVDWSIYYDDVVASVKR
ncbi:MAG TPA: hypothetical protein VJR89_00100 [Polyangiales bacterium]|nr:hypothetical protein [Polyangiales bacterium]